MSGAQWRATLRSTLRVGANGAREGRQRQADDAKDRNERDRDQRGQGQKRELERLAVDREDKQRGEERGRGGGGEPADEWNCALKEDGAAQGRRRRADRGQDRERPPSFEHRVDAGDEEAGGGDEQHEQRRQVDQCDDAAYLIALTAEVLVAVSTSARSPALATAFRTLSAVSSLPSVATSPSRVRTATRSRMTRGGRRSEVSTPALVLWQSFGFFDAETNRGVLAGLAERLRPGGRLILDLYNRDYWENAAGSDVVTRGGVARITNALDCARLTTVIEYLDSGESDRFDWELYRPSELPGLGAAVGLRCLLMCTECDEQKRPHRARRLCRWSMNANGDGVAADGASVRHSRDASPFPKIELHVHLEGTVRPERILEISRRNGYPFPAQTVNAVRDLYRYRDFAHFIDVWILTTNALQTER